MPMNLLGRDFLKEDDFTQKELQFLLDLSRDLKRAKYTGNERRLTQDDLVRYAREEDPWSCPGGCKRRIGFCA